MRRFLFSLLTVAAFATAAEAAVISAKPAPNFTARDAISGKEVSLENLRGKPVVLEWTNYDCPFVKKHYSLGTMQRLQQKAAKDGVIWISVNSGAKGKQGYLKNAAEARAAIAAQKASPAYYIRDTKGDIGKLYGAKTTPHMFVIAADGTLAYQGAIDDKASVDAADIATSKNYVTTALSQLAKGGAVTTPETSAYGCGVKYGM